jgi:glycosyltransferase involved in cell wall biosynthesis
VTSPSVSVIVPVYRNRATLRELHRRVSAVLEGAGRTFEILFVNDDCPAGSLEVLRELTAGDARVAVLSLASNVGQHQAVVTALSEARGEWVVVMDADLQDPPEALPELLRAGEAGFSAVFAGRCGEYESRFRLLTSR